MKIRNSLFFLFVFTVSLHAQKAPKPVARIAFWNVENFYDTINDPAVDDEEFLPKGKMKWTSERYTTKLEHLSKEILALGNGKGPDLLGMAEIENERVLVDLTTKTSLAKQKYGIVHYDSHDKRGIDVALLYKKDKFKVLASKTISVQFPMDSLVKGDTLFTRDILLVKGILAKDTIYIVVNHWPSRRGGSEASEGRRILAAWKLHETTDSLLHHDPFAKIVEIGDFNDEPFNKSILSLTGSDRGISVYDSLLLAWKKIRIADTERQKFYLFTDLMDSLKASGDGSYHYRKEVNMLDNILINRNFKTEKGLRIYDAHIFKTDWNTGENYKGDPPGPLHTYAGSRYIGGYSDHYPVYADVYLVKK
jgi:predicted extracellular nuclease